MGFSEGNFTIPETIILRVSADLGVPILDLEDLGINQDTLIALAIVPALHLYYSYYPIILKSEYPITANVDIPFPEEEVYGVAQARVALLQSSQSYGKNPWVNETLRMRTSAWKSYGKTSDGRDPYIRSNTLITEQAEQQSYINLTKAGNFNIDIENRRFWGYSNVQGNLIVNWAKFSRNWSTVRFEHESDVIDVAKMFALRFIGGIRDQSDPNTGVTADGSAFKERAQAIEASILTEKWRARIPMMVLR